MTAPAFDNDFTQRNTTFMSWNLMHAARILRDLGGFPAHGNQRSAWDDGERFGHPFAGVDPASIPERYGEQADVG